jgi:hypothetical protein
VSNVTPINPPGTEREKPSASDIHDIVIRAKQIVCAVREAEDQGGDFRYAYALQQVEDMLDEAGAALGILEDAEGREEEA